jgi:hypothetical protein
MAVVFPYIRNPTWADGSGGGTPINAAKLNLIDDGILNAHKQPAVRAYHNTTQSLTSGVATALALNSERFDQAGGSASAMHDNSTNNSRLTCLYAGIYQIDGCVEFASNATGARRIWIKLNNTTFIDSALIVTGSGDTHTLKVSCAYALAVNDYVELLASQTSGGALNVLSTANYSPEFSMVRVG